jgi:hypothetical protein
VVQAVAVDILVAVLAHGHIQHILVAVVHLLLVQTNLTQVGLTMATVVS